MLIGIYTKNALHIEKYSAFLTKSNASKVISSGDLSIFRIPTSSQSDFNVLSHNNCLIYGTVHCHSKEYVSLATIKTQRNNLDNYLFNKCWGHYIAIYTDENKNTFNMVVSPAGQLSLFYLKLDNQSLIFSTDLEPLINFIENKPSVNLDYAASYIMNGPNFSISTIFKEIKEVPPGCKLVLDSKYHILTTNIWNILKNQNNYNDLIIKNNLINTLNNVLKQGIKNKQNLFLDFSGGLDSSSLLYLLNLLTKDSSHKIHPINFYDAKVKSSDERNFARSIAREVGIELIEYDTAKATPFSPVKLTKKPNHISNQLAWAKMEQDLFSFSCGKTDPLFISGHGGDHIFLCPPMVESICDFILASPNKGISALIEDIQYFKRSNIFSIIKKVILGFTKIITKGIACTSMTNNKHIAWYSKDFLRTPFEKHPIFSAREERVLPGKQKHISIIINGLASIQSEIRNTSSPMFYPLFSQPMIELALSIPTYESFQGMYNRYIFRKSISDYCNTNQVWRKTKGETSGTTTKGFKENLKHILEICLEGKLVQAKVIDKNKLHECIQNNANGYRDNTWQVIHLYSTEIFLEQWC